MALPQLSSVRGIMTLLRMHRIDHDALCDAIYECVMKRAYEKISDLPHVNRSALKRAAAIAVREWCARLDSMSSEQQVAVCRHVIEQSRVSRAFDPPVPDASDPTDAHDHGIVRTSLHLLRDLRAREYGWSVHMIRCAIKASSVSVNTKKRAIVALASMCMLVDKVEPFEISVVDALTIVWSHVNRQPQSVSASLKETLTLQLAECVDTCPTGMVERVIGTLDAFYGRSTVSNIAALRDEILTMAAKVREENADADAGRMTSLLFDRASKVYVDGLDMSPAIVAKLVRDASVGFS